MLTILGPRDRRNNHCDQMSRRNFLTIGSMAAGALTLPNLLAMEANAANAQTPGQTPGQTTKRTGRSHKAIIHIYLPGGPSHLDMFDLKPDAPSEIRGEFMPTKTNVPGIEICELFPKMAKMMDKFAIIRSVVGSEGSHDGYQCMTGRKRNTMGPAGGGWPSGAAWVSKVLGPVNDAVPPNVSLMYPTGNRGWGLPYEAGFLGPRHNPVTLIGRKPGQTPEGLTLKDITLDRLNDRARLLRSMDTFRRDIDASGVMDGMDSYTQQAMGILTSSKIADALDLSKEDPKIVARYGEDDPTFQRDGSPRMVRNMLAARRLVEAGARVVSLNHSRWDWHGGDGMNFPSSRLEFPMLDQGLAALVTDLHERGLDKDVSVLVWGEFGRTPKINKMNSRDHWPQVSFAVVAGGGMRTGQVVGSTNRYAEHAQDRPVSFEEVWATMYHNMGIDPTTERIFDVSGRPQYLVTPGVEPVRELI